jgi:hypothetical protein
VNVSDLSRDLRAFGDDLDKPLRDALEWGATSVARAAKPLMRFRAEGAWATSSGARYGHIQDYYEARVATISAAVVSDHPAAPVWEWGGTIHPLLGVSLHHALSTSRMKEQMKMRLAAANMDRPPYTFRIPRLQPVANAADAEREQITQHLEDAVDALIREYGLDGD